MRPGVLTRQGPLMRRVGIAVGIVVLMGTAFAPSARAGGSPMEWDRPYYYPGETAVGRAPVWTKSTFDGAGRPEDGPYQMYLRPVPESESDYWYPTDDATSDPAAIYLGELTIDHDLNDTHGVARFSFLVPEVAAGNYLVDHCNSDCSLQLGDLIDTTIKIVGDEAQERRLITSRIERLDRRTGTRLFWLRERIGALEGDVAELSGAMSRTRNEMAALRLQLKKLSSGDDRSAAFGSASLLATFGGLGLAAAAIRRVARRTQN